MNRKILNEPTDKMELEKSGLKSAFERMEPRNSINFAEDLKVSLTQKLSCWQKFQQLKLMYHAFILLCILLVILSSIAAILFTLYSNCHLTSNPCMNGSCSLELYNDFKCTCKQGWVGKKCDFDCKSNPNGKILDGVCYMQG